MKLKDITGFAVGPTVRFKSDVGCVISTQKNRDGRAKYLVVTAKGQKVWWFADKCRVMEAA